LGFKNVFSSTGSQEVLLQEALQAAGHEAWWVVLTVSDAAPFPCESASTGWTISQDLFCCRVAQHEDGAGLANPTAHHFMDRLLM
jgi:hypothetical protein